MRLFVNFSFLFSVPSSAFVTLSCANLFIGIITTVTTFVLENFDDEELKNVGAICREVFLLFPQYCLGRGLMDMATESGLNAVIGQFGLESVRDRLDWNFLGRYLACLGLQGLTFLVATLLVQAREGRANPFSFSCFKTQVETEEQEQQQDEDVVAERERILSLDHAQDVLTVKNLFKRYLSQQLCKFSVTHLYYACSYPGGSRPAVDRLTFGVKPGECFGLLGQ